MDDITDRYLKFGRWKQPGRSKHIYFIRSIKLRDQAWIRKKKRKQ